MFLVWFYRARVNAEGHGWPQRLSPGWAIGAWFVPNAMDLSMIIVREDVLGEA